MLAALCRKVNPPPAGDGFGPDSEAAAARGGCLSAKIDYPTLRWEMDENLCLAERDGDAAQAITGTSAGRLAAATA